MYILGQILGIFATACCLVLPLFKKKWQMLVVTAVSNVCFALNLFLIGQVDSGMIIFFVAVVQTMISLWHTLKNVPVTAAENVIFLILYVVCGSLGFQDWRSLLPIVGAVFNMLATFQRDEQKTRGLILCNASCFVIYYLITCEPQYTGTGSALLEYVSTISTNIIAEAIAVITTVIALIKYRKKAA